MSRQLLLSDNDKGDNYIPWAVHRSPGIYLKSRKIPENLSLEPADEGCENTYHLKWVPLHINEVRMIAQHVRNREGRKKGNYFEENTTSIIIISPQ
jgi:hypothetical protein